jgi:hypothetical protein
VAVPAGAERYKAVVEGAPYDVVVVLTGTGRPAAAPPDAKPAAKPDAKPAKGGIPGYKPNELLARRVAQASDWVIRIAYDLPIDVVDLNLGAFLPQSRISQDASGSAYDSLMNYLPFENSFVVGGLTGGDLAVIANYIASVPGAVANVGNVSPDVVYYVDAAGNVSSVSYGGQTVGLDDFFIYVTNDYLFESPESFTLIVKVDNKIDAKDLLAYSYTELVSFLEYLVSPYVQGPPVYVTR